MKLISSLGLIALLTGLCLSANAQTLSNGNFDTDLSSWTSNTPNNLWDGGVGSDGATGFAWINDVENVVPYLT